MERIQEHKFVDLAAPVKQPKEPTGMSRRDFLAMATGVAAATAMAPEAFARNFIDQYDPDGPIARYPNPDVIVLDKRFKYKLGNTPIVRLYRGTMWAEGPAWSGVGRFLTWSDIPNNMQLRWLKRTVVCISSSAILRTTRTATSSIIRVGKWPANTVHGA